MGSEEDTLTLELLKRLIVDGLRAALPLGYCGRCPQGNTAPRCSSLALALHA